MTNFDTKLLELIEERNSVLFEIERVLFTKRYNLSQKHSEILSIQSISMIYSIWEGFIQNAFQLYIDELNDTDIEFNDYIDNIIIYFTEDKFKQLKSYPEVSNKKIALYNNFKTFYRLDKHIIKRVVDTKSNVNFGVLNTLLSTFGLKIFPEYWGIYCHPNPNLKDTLKQFLRYRNDIAHGGDISSQEKVTQKVYEKYKILVTDLMYEIRIKMLYGLENKTYQR